MAKNTITVAISLLVAILFFSTMIVAQGVAGMPGAADNVRSDVIKRSTVRKPEPIDWPCPSGWHHTSDNDTAFSGACKPDKPKPVKCPDFHEWRDDGCQVGCFRIPG